MRKEFWAVAMTLGGLVAGLCAGCGGAPDSSFAIDPEQDMPDDARNIGQVDQANITGCAAITVTSEAHAGIFLEHQNPRSIYIKYLRWTITNPTATDCPVVEIGGVLKDDIDGNAPWLDDAFAKTSLGPHKSRSFTWYIGYNSGRWWVDALLVRNRVITKTTYVPAYFDETGQIDQ